MYEQPNFHATIFTIVTCVDIEQDMFYHPNMNWTQIITDLQARGFTLEDIANECGFAGKGAVHDLKGGVRSASCLYERGVLLVAMHKKHLRKKIVRPKYVEKP